MNQQDAAGLLAAERVGTAEQLAGLERELAAIIESSGSANADDEHDPEGATIAFERQHLAALAAQARDHLAQIDAALARLADGSYGTCQGCGQPIGDARLTARPVSTLCITCASRRRSRS
jgi:RNA polymerase-binding protein DksA